MYHTQVVLMENTHVFAGLNPCNVFANAGAFGCRAKEARQAVAGLVASARAATRFDLSSDLIAAPRTKEAATIENLLG